MISARVLTFGFAFALLLSLLVAAPAHGAPNSNNPGANAGKGHGPTVSSALKHDTSPKLKTIKPSKSAQAAQAAQNKKTQPVPLHPVPHSNLNTAAKSGSADVQKSVTTNTMPAFGQNFEGVGNLNGVLPPDTQGAVGPNNYVQMINLSFAVYNKQGALLYGPVPNTTLWQGFGGPCETFNGGDPVTLYDENADRWFMSQLAYPGGSQGYHECIAISQTGDPTGAWYRYDFLFSSDTLNDYPKFGVWPDAYYMSANDFLNAASFTGVTVIAFNRAQMLAGQQATEVSFTIGTQYGSLLPANADGGALGFNPPAGAPEQFFDMCDDAWGTCSTDQIQMWNFHVDWNNPANSTFGNNGAPDQIFQTAPFDSNLCNYNRSCIPQPGTSVGLDTLADRLMYRADYRNLGGTQAIVFDDSVDVNGSDHAGIRWYELTNSGSGWSINQQGTYAPDSDNRWMGSAALDASGDIAIGFSVSSSSTYPSIRVAGRLAGDPAGELAQGESTMIAGGGSQTSGFSRWGDYAAMQVDPTDGCTFWFTSEYMQTTSNADWHTRIGSFKFPSCTAGPHGTLTGTVTDAGNNNPVVGATVSAGVASTTTDSQGNYTLTLPAATYDVTYSAFGYATQTVNGVQISDGGTTTENVALTPTPSVTLSGTVADGYGHGWPLYARIDITGRPGGPIFTNPATGHYSVTLPENATYSLKVTADIAGYQIANDSVTVGTSDLTHNISLLVDPTTCTVPGYHFQYGTPVLNEPFDGSTMPAGWTVVDNAGNGQVWQIGDPENRGNLTGGQGNFADINSDYYGFGSSQDTSLVSPVFDLSSQATPILQFHTDYNGFPGQTGAVDVTTDGGTTWTNVWQHTSDSVRGPDLEQVAIPQAGGHGSVQLRFHFISSFGWWWEVDDVAVMNRSCAPIPGGLVVGNVNDANTNAGVNGATVISGDQAADKGTTRATPDDPNLGDGYYWLFSSLTGSHPFSASKPPYQSDTETVNVAADGTTAANFSLKAGQLTITPSSVSQSQVLGNTSTSTVTITNTGTAAANVKLDERGGAFQILTAHGAPLRLIEMEDGDLASPAFLGNKTGDNGPGVYAGAPKDPTWSTIASYPSGIMDNSADFINGKEYSVGGIDTSFAVTNKGYVYDPNTDTWTPIANMPVAREKPGVAAVNGKLYVSGGWDSSGNPVAETDVYDPSTDSWSTVSPNPHPAAAPGVAVANGKIYFVAGCSDAFCTTTTTSVVYDPGSDSWASIAAYPVSDSWQACGGLSGKVYCAGGTNGSATYKSTYAYDTGSDSWTQVADMPIDLWASVSGAPNGMFVVSSGVTNGFSTITNQGYAYDPSADSWSAIPNAQFPRYRAGGSCGFYKIGGSSGGFNPTADSELLSGLTLCGVIDVPWLAESPTTATLQPGQSATITITLSATTADQVTQPGTYTAQLGVEQNTPYPVSPIDITMTVTPPKGWGKITGTVTGTDCKGNTAPLGGVQIQANGKGYTFTLKTDKNGNYAFWAPSGSNSYQIIASDNGWIAQTTKVNIKSQKTVTVNFNLQRTSC